MSFHELQARVRELLDYDQLTGVFTWRVTRGSKAPAGTEAGHRGRDGYIWIGIDRKLYLAHRLAWLYVHGILPPMLDHVNRRKDDNRIGNLRPASFSLNSQNAVKGRAGRSLPLGVSARGKGFTARIVRDGCQTNLGMFATAADAQAAYLRAKAVLHAGAIRA